MMVMSAPKKVHPVELETVTLIVDPGEKGSPVEYVREPPPLPQVAVTSIGGMITSRTPEESDSVR
jgi:hypothetical protein